VVLSRKAGIVVLAVLVTNPYFQCAGAALLLALALALQLSLQPFARPLFNALESLSLAASLTTAVVSGMLLQYDVTAPAFLSRAPAAMTAEEWAITAVLAVVNLATLTVVGGTWAWLQLSSCSGRVGAIRAAASARMAARSDRRLLQPAATGAGRLMHVNPLLGDDGVGARSRSRVRTAVPAVLLPSGGEEAREVGRPATAALAFEPRAVGVRPASSTRVGVEAKEAAAPEGAVMS
jgi:hypothetical protein